MVHIQTSAVADTETMNRVVLNVDVVDRARTKDLGELNEMVRPSRVLVMNLIYVSSHSLFDAAVATEAIPPRLTVTIEDSTLCGGDLEVGAANLDERVVGIEVLPESSSLEGDLGASLQLRQVDGRISRDGNAIKDNGSTGCHGCRDGRVSSNVASIRGCTGGHRYSRCWGVSDYNRRSACRHDRGRGDRRRSCGCC